MIFLSANRGGWYLIRELVEEAFIHFRLPDYEHGRYPIMKKEKQQTQIMTSAKVKLCMIGLIFFLIGFMLSVLFTQLKLTNYSKSEANSHQVVDYKKKEKELKNILAKNPDNVSAWTQLGHLYFDSNQFTKAIEAYEKSISTDPENPTIKNTKLPPLVKELF